jgi:hypothetical protein
MPAFSCHLRGRSSISSAPILPPKGFPGPDQVLAPVVMPPTTHLHADQTADTATQAPGPYLTVITPWADEILDRRGHDPCGPYVETFWLGVIGPSATWVMRRFTAELNARPEGCRIDLALVAATMGLSSVKGHSSPFGRALSRCVMFGLARPTATGFEVRRKFPTLSPRHLERLPRPLTQAHQLWLQQPGVHLHLLGLDHRHRHLSLHHENL